MEALYTLIGSELEIREVGMEICKSSAAFQRFEIHKPLTPIYRFFSTATTAERIYTTAERFAEKLPIRWADSPTAERMAENLQICWADSITAERMEPGNLAVF